MDLPFLSIWVIAFEYIAGGGDLPVPVCLCAKELRTGQSIRLWQDELPADPPYPIDENALFVSYDAPAELGCHLVLGWPMPTRILDLYVEFRAVWNGGNPPAGYGLLGALSAYGLPGITNAEKETGRALVLRGPPWSEAEKLSTLDYCWTDVAALELLLPKMLPGIVSRPMGLGHALLRGRYQAAVARMETTGVPVDVETLGQLRAGWADVKLKLVTEMDPHGEIFEGVSFREARFSSWLERERIAWPRLPSGSLDLKDETFRGMSLLHPQVAPIRELRRSLSQMRLSDLAVGSDGRNRVMLSPFRAKTGRNQPSNSAFIFGTAKWLRGLIKPGRGKALAYIDWAAQEIGIAAALSGDAVLLDAVQSGDPYIAFAKLAGLVPEDAIKGSHPIVRDKCKALFLGTNYGMGAVGLATRLGVCTMEAQHLLSAHSRVFSTYKRWADDQVDVAMLDGKLMTRFGWPIWVTSNPNPRSLLNFPAQANANEMLRIAASLATEAGLRVCCPVHDAVLLEVDEATAEHEIAACREVMAKASRVVLDGFELKTEATEVRWPGRYMAEGGSAMWERVTAILESNLNY